MVFSKALPVARMPFCLAALEPVEPACDFTLSLIGQIIPNPAAPVNLPAAGRRAIMAA
jgi:hypothetical protein